MSRKTPEGRFKDELTADLEFLFPRCVILKNDANSVQGIPDMLILWHEHWAMLEVKESRIARKQPNQEWWVETFDYMSFAAFIYPENKEEVLDALQLSFGVSRPSRLSRR